MTKKIMVNGAVLTAASIAMTGCVAPKSVKVAEEANKQNKETLEKTISENAQLSKRNHFLKESDSIYISEKAFRVSEKDMLPRFFQDEIVITRPDAAPLGEIFTTIADDLGVRVTLTSDAQEFLSTNGSGTSSTSAATDSTGLTADGMAPVVSETSMLTQSSFDLSINYQGNIEGLFDNIAAKTSLYWKWKDNRVTFYRLETRTFTLDTLTGNSDYEAYVQTQSATNDASASGAGSSDNTTYQRTGYKSNPDSAWDNIEGSINVILAGEGEVSFAEQTGTYTVTATPTTLDAIEDYLEQMNSILSERIMMKTEIYEISINDNDNVGLDFDAIWSGSSNFSFQLSTPFNNTGDISFGILAADSNWTGSSGLVNALKQNYETTLVNSSIAHTTNGVPVPVQVMNSLTYLAEQSVVTSDTGTTTSLEPGTLNTGVNMSLLPKTLSNGDIMINMSLDLSSLNSIDRYTSPDGSVQMDLPNTDQKNFMQRVAVRSGESIIISGFERTKNDANTDSIFGSSAWALGGRKSGGTVKTKTIILITPYTVAR